MKSKSYFAFLASVVLLGVANKSAGDYYVTEIIDKGYVTSVLQETVTDISSYTVNKIFYIYDILPYWNGTKF